MHVKLILLPAECQVCGQPVDDKFLKVWNGKDVCKYCIAEINEESEHIANYHQYQRA